MKLDLTNEENYLLDAHGDPLWIGKSNSIYYNMVHVKNYQSFNLDYVNCKIQKEDIKKYFTPISNINGISFVKKTKSLHSYTLLYKSKTSDTFILISLDLSNQSGWDEADENSFYKEGYYKIHNLFYKREDEQIEQILEHYNTFLDFDKSDKASVSLVIKTIQGFKIKDFDIKPIEIDIKKHYNEDFEEVNKVIKENLTNQNKGIIMLHGNPGTGKTNYIKNLTTEVPEKRFIFVPPSLVGYLSDPSFIENLIENNNAVLVLEDCEVYLKDRGLNTGNNNFVSSLLNISDGILSDILSLQIICTFNNDLKSIDSALLREGRLIAEYKFQELSIEKSNFLIEELNIEMEKGKKRNLSDIYNYKKSVKGNNKQVKIGF